VAISLIIVFFILFHSNKNKNYSNIHVAMVKVGYIEKKSGHKGSKGHLNRPQYIWASLQAIYIYKVFYKLL